MLRLMIFSAAATLGLVSMAPAGPFACLNGGIHCICPPAPSCPDCCGPCDRGFHHCSCRKSERAHRLIEELNCNCCCDRIRAAERLGSRLLVDACCDPEILSALAHAVQCDSCWEVRRAAAWSIAHQNGRTEVGVLSLYLASKLDPHYLVRDSAKDALDVLLVCRKDCFKDLFARADDLAKKLKGKYKPGTADCVQFLDACLAAPALAPVTTAPPLAPAK